MEGGKELRVCGGEKKKYLRGGEGGGNILSGPFGISLGSSWDCFGIVLGSFRYCFGVVLGWFWVSLGSVWEHFGINLGSLWDHLGRGGKDRKNLL